MENLNLLIAAAEGPGAAVFWIVIPIVVALGVLFTIIYFVAVREKKRTARLEIVVGEMGLEFRPEGDEQLLGRLGAFPLMNVGRKQELKNLVVGDTSQGKLALFDFRYITGHGKHQKTRRQTVIAMEAAELDQLPSFNMRPEGFWDRVGSAFGMKDVDFDEHADFSAKFLLKGEDEEALRAFMDKELLDFFADRPDLCCEARPGVFLYYRRYKCVTPESHLLEGFLEEGMMVFLALLERQMRE
jgi:hypothetical protein